MGRPKWIPDELTCKKAKDMASRGLTILQIADCLGVSHTTIYERQNEFPEFAEAIKRGRSQGIKEVAKRDRESWGDEYIDPVKEIPPINIIVDSNAINQAAK